MSRADWYCHECETFGGGEPNNLTPVEHIDIAHDGGLARIEKASAYRRKS